MNTLIFVAGLLTVGSAIFFPPFGLSKFGGQPMTRLCIQSVDPSRYQPKCIFCPNSVYLSVVQVCVNGTSIPRNVTFVQASCLEQNCLIRGKRSISIEAYSNSTSESPQHKEIANHKHHDGDASDQQSEDPESDMKSNSEGVNIVNNEETVAGPEMLYAEWVQNNFETNDVDKDYENFR